MKIMNLKQMMMLSVLLAIFLVFSVKISFGRELYVDRNSLQVTTQSVFVNTNLFKLKAILFCFTTIGCNIFWEPISPDLNCKRMQADVDADGIRGFICREYHYLTTGQSNPIGNPTRLLVEKSKVYIELENRKYLLTSDNAAAFYKRIFTLSVENKITKEEFKKRIEEFQKNDAGIVSERTLNLISQSLNIPIVRDSDTKNPVDETIIGLFMPNQNQVLDGKITESITELKDKGKPVVLSGYDKELTGKEKVYQFAPTSVKIYTDNKSLSNEKHQVEISYEIMKAKDGNLFAVPFPVISTLAPGKKNEDCNVRCGTGKGKCGVDFCWELLPSDSTIKPYTDDLLRTNVPNAVNHRFVNGKNRFAYQTKIGEFKYLIIIETNIPNGAVALVDDGRKWCCCFVRKANRIYCQRIIKEANCVNLCAKVNKAADSQK